MNPNHFLTDEVCSKHPELDGLRRIQDRRCVGCHRDERTKGAGRKRTRAREVRIRDGFMRGSAEVVLSNIAIEHAIEIGVNPSLWRSYVAIAAQQVEEYRLRICPDAPPLPEVAVVGMVQDYAQYVTVE